MAVKQWIVSGFRGCGKTTFCQTFVRKAQKLGMDVAGILSPALYLNGEKESIWAEDIRGEERRRLAGIQRLAESDLAYGPLFFDPQVIEWGNRVLAASVPCDVLVVDELGPLEFEQASGWLSAFDALASERYTHALVVVRPELLPVALHRIKAEQVIHINQVDEVRERAEFYVRLLAPGSNT